MSGKKRSRGTSEIFQERISSPAATGGAGTVFEQHVGTYWLAQLLIRGIPPVLHRLSVAEVHFQTEHMGWNTDDFLVVARGGDGETTRKLVGQVKRSFTVSSRDDDCKKAIADFWSDFHNTELFHEDRDCLVLVTLRGTNTLLEHFVGLLDCARSARTSEEFERRLATKGLISKKSVNYCNQIRTIIGNLNSTDVSQGDLWPFLKVMHVVSLDLTTSTRQTEAVIKTVLAHTSNQDDAIAGADRTWSELHSLACDAIPQARSFTRDDLPSEVRFRHEPIGSTESQPLRALEGHTSLILGGIRPTIGRGLHLDRFRIAQQLIEGLESSQVVLLSGDAGTGKSVVARSVMEALGLDHFCFAFRAEEFACPHLDDTLSRAQIGASASALGGLLAAQSRKFLLVESLERLLEASTRDAFSDLLTLVKQDPSWRVLLTCRAYSAEIVRAAFLRHSQVRYSTVVVGPFDDEELAAVKAAEPSLERPLASPSLMPLLRNPYILDKAARMDWRDEVPLPANEREFRSLFWREVIRAEPHAERGLARMRERAFVEVALRRARAMTLYVRTVDLNALALDALQADALIASPPGNADLLAPAHDVLEDWAILHWINQKHLEHEDDPNTFAADMGTFPAIRRTYRFWLSELVQCNTLAATRLYEAVVGGTNSSLQFRDDTLVAILRSPAAPSFLVGQRSALFAREKATFWRIVHLLRVACVKEPDWINGSDMRASLLSVPDGPAWACVLEMVASNLASFSPNEYPQVLALLEDWARGVCPQTPYPAGAAFVASIAHHMLPDFDDYRGENRKRLLRILVRIPKADTDRFVELWATTENGVRNRVREDLLEFLRGADTLPIARDMPDLVIEQTRAVLLAGEHDLENDGRYRRRELELVFGIKEANAHGYWFPPSALRGPVRPLLHFHPAKALAFIVEVFNHCADWHAQPRVPLEGVEPPIEAVLTLFDGPRTQWANGRLWSWYRGVSVGPYALQSILMALEEWLLAYGEALPDSLDGRLLSVLRGSDSAAISAVVASVATAYPYASPETLLAMLSCREFIGFDRSRMSQESQAGLSYGSPNSVESGLFSDERKESAKHPHRRRDLESAILSLQAGPYSTRVQEALDEERGKVRPAAEQNEADRIWRLALHRMDLRQYNLERPTSQETGDDNTIVLRPHRAEPDVQAMVDGAATRIQEMEKSASLFMWGIKVFEGSQEQSHYDPAEWRERLKEVKGAGESTEGVSFDPERATGFIAAIAVRDHWDEMHQGERDWCIETTCSCAVVDADDWTHFTRVQVSGGMSSRGACVLTVPRLLRLGLSQAQREEVLKALVVGLTHAVDEMRGMAALGIGRSLWEFDRELTLSCVAALATQANEVQKSYDRQLGLPYDERRSSEEIESEIAASVRTRFLGNEGFQVDAIENCQSDHDFGAVASAQMLAILREAPNEELAIRAFEALATNLVGWWDQEDKNRGSSIRQRSYGTISSLRQHLEYFVLRIESQVAHRMVQPLIEAIDKHPREVHSFVEGLIFAEDGANTSQFWQLWSLFADGIKTASWLNTLGDEYSTGDEMISAIFLSPWWNDGIHHWPGLEGQIDSLHGLFAELPPSATVMDKYIRFLYGVGRQESLPSAFVGLSKKLSEAPAQALFQASNTVYMLEVLLQHFVYGRPQELKSKADLRQAVLDLLDSLVESGASAAFRMRDDFVTPMSPRAKMLGFGKSGKPR